MEHVDRRGRCIVRKQLSTAVLAELGRQLLILTRHEIHNNDCDVIAQAFALQCSLQTITAISVKLSGMLLSIPPPLHIFRLLRDSYS